MRLITCLVALVFMGCSSSAEAVVSSVVKNVTLQKELKDKDEWVTASAVLDLGNFQLLAFKLPIDNPINLSESFGTLSYVPTSKTLTISIDITRAANGPSYTPVLPNGSTLPVKAGDERVVTLPVGTSAARVYLAMGDLTRMLGAAIPFVALDLAGKEAPSTGVFVPVTFGEVAANPGMFFGEAPNSTGLALFVDLSSAIKNTSPIEMTPMKQSDDEQSRVGQVMMQLDDKHTVLVIE